jgi:hypothetical protein
VSVLKGWLPPDVVVPSAVPSDVAADDAVESALSDDERLSRNWLTVSLALVPVLDGGSRYWR